MQLQQNEFYHVYNQGNNKQPIFFSAENYLFFIKKLRQQVLPVADIIAWCLMPNHFHLIIHANENSVASREAFGCKSMQQFAYRMGTLQSSYAQAVNLQQKSSGSLFRQKTKAKQLTGPITQRGVNYLETCFFYLINNPREAKLVEHLEDWPYSCYLDYLELRNGTICNKQLLYKFTGLNTKAIQDWTNWDISDELRRGLYD